MINTHWSSITTRFIILKLPMITLTVNFTLMTDEISDDSRVVKNKKHAGVV